MLAQMRRMSTAFSKTILGIIALVFILYFGFNQFGGSGAEPGVVAEVNRQSIPAAKFYNQVQQQSAFFQQLNIQGLQNQLGDMIESQVMQRLIQNTLLSQAASKLGIRVSDEQLANEIRNNPNFQKEGIFDENLYLKTFKPFYARQNGVDFEYDLRQDLAREKLEGLIAKLAVVNDQEVQDLLTLNQVKMKLNKLEVPVSEKLNKDQAKKLIENWIALKESGQSTQSFLTTNGLKENEIPLASIYELVQTIGREEGLSVFTCLFTLRERGVCKTPFTSKQNFVAYELLEKKIEPITLEQQNTLTQQLTIAEKNQLLEGLINLLTKEAKIKTYLTKK